MNDTDQQTEPETIICDECSGEGYVDDAGEFLCLVCMGTGVIEVRKGEDDE